MPKTPKPTQYHQLSGDIAKLLGLNPHGKLTAEVLKLLKRLSINIYQYIQSIKNGNYVSIETYNIDNIINQFDENDKLLDSKQRNKIKHYIVLFIKSEILEHKYKLLKIKHEYNTIERKRNTATPERLKQEIFKLKEFAKQFAEPENASELAKTQRTINSLKQTIAEEQLKEELENSRNELKAFIELGADTEQPHLLISLIHQALSTKNDTLLDYKQVTIIKAAIGEELFKNLLSKYELTENKFSLDDLRMLIVGLLLTPEQNWINNNFIKHLFLHYGFNDLPQNLTDNQSQINLAEKAQMLRKRIFQEPNNSFIQALARIKTTKKINYAMLTSYLSFGIPKLKKLLKIFSKYPFISPAGTQFVEQVPFLLEYITKANTAFSRDLDAVLSIANVDAWIKSEYPEQQPIAATEYTFNKLSLASLPEGLSIPIIKANGEKHYCTVKRLITTDEINGIALVPMDTTCQPLEIKIVFESDPSILTEFLDTATLATSKAFEKHKATILTRLNAIVKDNIPEEQLANLSLNIGGHGRGGALAQHLMGAIPLLELNKRLTQLEEPTTPNTTSTISSQAASDELLTDRSSLKASLETEFSDSGELLTPKRLPEISSMASTETGSTTEPSLRKIVADDLNSAVASYDPTTQSAFPAITALPKQFQHLMNYLYSLSDYRQTLQTLQQHPEQFNAYIDKVLKKFYEALEQPQSKLTDLDTLQELQHFTLTTINSAGIPIEIRNNFMIALTRLMQLDSPIKIASDIIMTDGNPMQLTGDTTLIAGIDDPTLITSTLTKISPTSGQPMSFATNLAKNIVWLGLYSMLVTWGALFIAVTSALHHVNFFTKDLTKLFPKTSESLDEDPLLYLSSLFAEGLSNDPLLYQHDTTIDWVKIARFLAENIAGITGWIKTNVPSVKTGLIPKAKKEVLSNLANMMLGIHLASFFDQTTSPTYQRFTNHTEEEQNKINQELLAKMPVFFKEIYKNIMHCFLTGNEQYFRSLINLAYAGLNFCITLPDTQLNHTLQNALVKLAHAFKVYTNIEKTIKLSPSTILPLINHIYNIVNELYNPSADATKPKL